MSSIGVAVIVEPRCHKALALSVLSIHHVLPDWPIALYHSKANLEYAKTELKEVPNMIYKLLPQDNLTIPDYNDLMTSLTFYDEWKEYEYMLIFQTDTLLFPQSPFQIEHFLGYDYIGAPWSWAPEQKGGNGGLSLRRIQTMRRCLVVYPYPRGRGINEDSFFSNLPIQYPPRTIAKQFSVESDFYPCPFGIHKPWWYMDGYHWSNLIEFAPQLQQLRRLNEE